MGPDLELSTGRALEISQNPHTGTPFGRSLSNRLSGMVARNGATPRNRWNDAVTTPLQVVAAHVVKSSQLPVISRFSASHGHLRVTLSSSADGSLPMAFAVSREDLPWRYHTKVFPLARGRPLPPSWSHLPEAWHPPESNKGPSERLSALGGKSTRVRRKSPSKTPKNGF